jgi:hypothetical protein
MRITLDILKKKRACLDKQRLFKKLFGDSVDVTEELCIQHARDFDWSWAARSLLNDAAQLACDEAEAAACAAYNAAVASAWTAYSAAVAPARAAYDEAEASACAAYNEATARAFWRASCAS